MTGREAGGAGPTTATAAVATTTTKRKKKKKEFGVDLVTNKKLWRLLLEARPK